MLKLYEFVWGWAFFGAISTVLKLHAQFHRDSLIRKCYKSGETKSLTKKQKILFLGRFLVYFKVTYKHKFSKFKMRFSAAYLYCSEKSINNSGKKYMLHRRICTPTPTQVFFGSFWYKLWRWPVDIYAYIYTYIGLFLVKDMQTPPPPLPSKRVINDFLV